MTRKQPIRRAASTPAPAVRETADSRTDPRTDARAAPRTDSRSDPRTDARPDPRAEADARRARFGALPAPVRPEDTYAVVPATAPDPSRDRYDADEWLTRNAL